MIGKIIAPLSELTERLSRFFFPPPCPQVPFTFSIGRKGRDEYVYGQAGRFLVFYAEMLVGPVQRDLGIESIGEWLPPHEQDEMTDAERAQILQNICTYFDRNDITYQT